MEMEQWWRRNKNVMEGDMVRGGYTKDQIEDITGGIPLFLDSCLLKDEKGDKGQLFMSLDTAFLTETYGQAWMYEEKIRSKFKNNMANLNLYVTLVFRFIPTMSLIASVTTNI
jgi:hypothetical protein